MNQRYPLPGDTQHVLSRFHLTQCRNPGLLFSRYTPDWQNDPTLKKKGLEIVRNTKPDNNLLRALCQRWRHLVASMEASIFEATTEWRLIVGLGQNGPLEVGFTFHRLYGIPIIPGSSLKGLARTYAHMVEERDEEEVDFRSVFGCAPKTAEKLNQGQAGGAIFFDAIPLNTPDMELDVMNPHYPDYYRGEAPPTNWQNPVPIYFLAIKPGVRFAFAVGWRENLNNQGKKLLNLAVKWLKGGLMELGAGAKTSAGYGYFTFLE